jgi:hypothetical protein
VADELEEHLQCLNRGSTDTGPEWMEANLLAVSAALLSAQEIQTGGRIPRPLDVQLFWGWEDQMVPRKGQREPLCHAT